MCLGSWLLIDRCSEPLLLVDPEDDHDPSLVVGFPYEAIRIVGEMQSPCAFPLVPQRRTRPRIFGD